MYTDLEIFVVEIRGRNKNTPSLACAVYQPSSIEIEKLEWLEKFEQFLANLYTTWNGVLIITGDFNINLLSHQNESTNRYKNILHIFLKPTRKGETLIDHISCNISTKLVHCNVISTDEISDHDEPYAIFNIKKERFQKRYKYVRDEKNVDMNKYILDFKQLTTSLVYAFDEPDDKISVLNKLVNQCVSEHASIKRTKFTHPSAPWLKDPEISKAKNVLENLRTKSCDLNHSDVTVRQNNQTPRNRYEKNN